MKSLNVVLNRLPAYAPVVLRIAMALVVLWFGYQQLTHNSMWTSLVPEYAISTSHMSASTLVTLNGIFELVFGTLLLLGLFTRLAALLLALHFIEIIAAVGYGAIGVRDFGLGLATFAVFLFGSDMCSLDRLFAQKTIREEKI